jgi:hypothetical protein
MLETIIRNKNLYCGVILLQHNEQILIKRSNNTFTVVAIKLS